MFLFSVSRDGRQSDNNTLSDVIGTEVYNSRFRWRLFSFKR